MEHSLFAPSARPQLSKLRPDPIVLLKLFACAYPYLCNTNSQSIESSGRRERVVPGSRAKARHKLGLARDRQDDSGSRLRLERHCIS